MHNHADGGSDLAVSFDAFTVTRDDGTDSLGMLARWKVNALYPWARDMLRTEAALLALQDHSGTPLAGSADGFIRVDRGDLDQGVGFERRKDALSFLRDVERAAMA